MTMKNEWDRLEEWLTSKDTTWDIEETPQNHEYRFMQKLENRSVKRKKRNLYTAIGIAATVVLMFSVSFFFKPETKAKHLNFASVETKQTDSIFTVMIQQELNKLKEIKSPKNQKMVSDALLQMRKLDSDYQKITEEIAANGENKQLIYAMISNLQVRISFLQNVLNQIEATEQLNSITDEKTL